MEILFFFEPFPNTFDHAKYLPWKLYVIPISRFFKLLQGNRDRVSLYRVSRLKQRALWFTFFAAETPVWMVARVRDGRRVDGARGGGWRRY